MTGIRRSLAGLAVLVLALPSLAQAGDVVVGEVPPMVSGIDAGTDEHGDAVQYGEAGDEVIIEGRDLGGATTVDFGTTPASFEVVDEYKVVAIAPPGSGTVAVTVASPGGASAPSFDDWFTYILPPSDIDSEPPTVVEHAITPASGAAVPPVTSPPLEPGGVRQHSRTSCVVPNLSGATLAAARLALRGGRCRLGSVTRPRRPGRHLVVVSQAPRAGRRLGVGSSVSVRLGRTPQPGN